MERLNSEQLRKKNREGISNIILVIGSLFIIFGIVIGIYDFELYSISAFIMNMIGVLLINVANYLRYGYIKFFN